MAQFQTGPRAETAHVNNGPLLCNYLKIVRFFYRHFDYKIRIFLHLNVTNNTNFGDVNRERLLATICEFVETLLPVDLYSSPYQNSYGEKADLCICQRYRNRSGFTS